MMRILITGATGFVGRHLLKVIHRRKPEARVFTAVRRKIGNDPAQLVVDFRRPGELWDLIHETKPDLVFHLMADPTVAGLNEQYSANAMPGICLMEFALKVCPTARIILMGSAAEYGEVRPDQLPVVESGSLRPFSPYGLAKSWQTAAAGFYARQGLEVVVARLFNLLGPGVPHYLAVGSFAVQLMGIMQHPGPGVIQVGNLSCKRDFVDVRDVCEGLCDLAERGVAGEVYNICSGVAVSLADVLDRMIALTGKPVEVCTDPKLMRSLEVSEIYGSSGKIAHLSDWHPSYDLESSIAATMGASSLEVSAEPSR